MGFLDRLFRRGKKQQGIVELKFEEVEPFVEERRAERVEIIEKEVPARFSEIKHIIHNTKTSLKGLENAEVSDEGNKRFRKAVKTAKKDSVRRLNSVLHKIEPPFSKEPEKVRDYAHESLELLQRKVRETGKSLTYTSVVLKDKMREVGKHIDSLENSLKSLVKTVKDNRIVFEKKGIDSSLESVKSDREKLERAESEIAGLKKTLAAIAERKNAAQKSLDSLLGSDASSELRALEGEKKKLLLEKLSIRNEMLGMISGVARPVKKLANMVSKGTYFLDDETKKALGVFLEDPSKLLRRDPKAESFKLLLKELKGVIVSEKLDLKGKEREKKLAEIDSLLQFDFFSNFFWKENELEKQVNAVTAKEKAIGVKGQIEEKRRALSELERDYAETGTAISEFEKKRSQVKEKISAGVKELGSVLSDVTEEKVEIRAPPEVEAPKEEQPGEKPKPEKPPKKPPEKPPEEKPREKPPEPEQPEEKPKEKAPEPPEEKPPAPEPPEEKPPGKPPAKPAEMRVPKLEGKPAPRRKKKKPKALGVEELRV